MTTADKAVSRLSRILTLGGGRRALYPPPRDFGELNDAQFKAAIHTSNGDPIPARLALHFDVPARYRGSFCHPPPAIGEEDANPAALYRDRLIRELGLVASLFDRDRDVVRVNLAPGMTRWMTPAQVEELLDSLFHQLHLHRRGDLDLAMTLDGETRAVRVNEWAALGFNRIGIGLGALASHANAAHLREAVARQLDTARQAGFANIRMEVPYAMPGQDDATFAALLDAVIAARPERVVLRYCGEPKNRNSEKESDARHRQHARLLCAAADRLGEAGYHHVGGELFALEDDPLLRAQRSGHIHRDVLGFGAHGTTHLVGFGVGAISQLGRCYAQNPEDPADWERRIDSASRAVARGLVLNEEDQLRARIFQQIMCHGYIDADRLEHWYHIEFRRYFDGELTRLAPLFVDGSLAWAGNRIVLDPIARLASSAIASLFDPHTLS
ncbi:hypothetical protein [Solilutibacter pythonis]|nr:hypothetical protein [Lysobacter pythonis]